MAVVDENRWRRDGLELKAWRVPWDRGVAFCLFARDNGNRHTRSVATNVTFGEVDEEQQIEPTFTLSDTEVQLLMDELWRSGYRPTSVGTVGELAATKGHLEDMRRLVAKAMDAPELKEKNRT